MMSRMVSTRPPPLDLIQTLKSPDKGKSILYLLELSTHLPHVELDYFWVCQALSGLLPRVSMISTFGDQARARLTFDFSERSYSQGLAQPIPSDDYWDVLHGTRWNHPEGRLPSCKVPPPAQCAKEKIPRNFALCIRGSGILRVDEARPLIM